MPIASPVTKPVIAYEYRSDGPNPKRVANDPNTYEVTSPFGPRDIILANGVRTTSAHGALDIANGHPGGEVVAPWAGHVLAEGFLGWPWSEPTSDFPTGNYGGLMAVVEHPNGLISLFAHLNQTVIWAGDDLAAGQLIGYIGGTGSADGSWHLHWALVRATVSAIYANQQRIKNEWLVDPWPYLAGTALPDTALEEDMFINLLPVREDWITKTDRTVYFWTDGPGMGERKAFVGANRITTHGESPADASGKSEWRVFALQGDPRTLWVRRDDLISQGNRVPKTGYGPFLAAPVGVSQADYDAARSTIEAQSDLIAGQKTAIAIKNTALDKVLGLAPELTNARKA